MTLQITNPRAGYLQHFTRICLMAVVIMFALPSLCPAGSHGTAAEGVARSPEDTGDSWNFAPLGRWAYGPCQTLSVFHGITAAGNGGYVQFWDLRNPAFPDLLGQVALPSIIEAIDFDGYWAYVANHYDGLQIVEYSTPGKPTIYSSLPLAGRAYDVEHRGDYVFVASDLAGLHVVDISNPRFPAEVGHLDTAGDARGVCVDGDYAYVADMANGLVIVDISRPGKPSLVATYDTPGLARDVVVLDGIAYVADGNYGVIAIDVSTPSSPTLYGTSDPFLAWDVQAATDVVFTSTNTMGLVILDVSKGGTFSIIDSHDPGGAMIDIALEGTEVFTACSNEGVKVIDCSSLPPGLAGGTTAWQFTHGIDVDGKYAYVGNSIPGMVVLDVSDPGSPKQVALYDTPDQIQSVLIDNDLAWVCDRFTGLIIVNVATPSHPAPAGSFNSPGWAYNVALSGHYAYLADGAVGGLRILDVSPPICCPTEVGSIDTPGEALDVAVYGDYAYVADGGEGIRIIDINPPESPTEVGFFEPDHGWVSALEVDGTHLYVANSNGGLLILDLSTPGAPTEAEEVLWGWTSAQDLEVVGDYVYVGDYEFGVRAFYIADPTNAVPVGTFDNGGRTKAIAASGTRVYLAEERIGVSILDFSPPPTATTVQAFDARVLGYGVALKWEIESDDVIAGYRIYRSTTGNAPRAVNAGGLIPHDVFEYTDGGVEPGNTYTYTLMVMLDDGSEIVSPQIEVTVEALELALDQNVPNPFNPTTTISFALPRAEHVTLSVFDVNGRLVRTLVDSPLRAGFRRYVWDGSDAAGVEAASGVYFYRLTAGTRTLVRKMVLLK